MSIECPITNHIVHKELKIKRTNPLIIERPIMQKYPIGSLGLAWGKPEVLAWFNNQTVKRSYKTEVIDKFAKVSAHFVKIQYGALPIDEDRYPLYAFVSDKWDNNKSNILVTGGVHGYETSGVQGALDFLHHHAAQYKDHFNFVVVPCLSPWAYETINRWTTNAVDPNRSFSENSPSPEAQQIMDFMSRFFKTHKGKDNKDLLAHFDLHETTDTDNSEFRPALAARDGITLDEWEVPDGFYTVADTSRTQLDFQNAIIESVRKVTHIAPPDHNNQIIGSDVAVPGVICYDKRSLFLCGGFTQAAYVTTTEVYPDSPLASPESCIKAQVAAISGGLDYLINHFS